MRSTFNILFYVNKSKEKNGVVPIIADEYFKFGNGYIHWYLFLKAAKLVSPEKYGQICLFLQ